MEKCITCGKLLKVSPEISASGMICVKVQSPAKSGEISMNQMGTKEQWTFPQLCFTSKSNFFIGFDLKIFVAFVEVI